MKRILVPTDFSATAKKAFHFALDIAKTGKGSVILYHNYMPLESPFIDTEELRKQYNSQEEAKLEQRLQTLKEKVPASYQDVPVSTVLGGTPLIYSILNFAEQNQIDLIVMGTQGASGFKKTIIGTVAARIVKNTKIPVLLVPEKFKWKPPGRIVFAADCQKTDRLVLSRIFSLAELYSSELTVMHLCSAKDIKNEKTDFDNYALTLQKEFSQFTLDFQLIKTDSAIQSMKNLYKEVPCDMIVMIRRNKPFWERFFLESFTEQTAFATHLPLLVVPEEEH